METTLAKGLKMLEAVARSKGPRGVSDLGRELGLTRSNAHRLLQTLSALGYVRHDPINGVYESTLRLFELGSEVIKYDIRAIARPVMQALARRTGENVVMSVRDGCDVLVLERAEGTRALRTYTSIGTRSPMHCTSPGKLLLAHAPAGIVEEVARALISFTPRTINSKTKLLAELDRIRAQGYAVARAEWHEDVSGICAPIMRSGGAVVAGISVSGPVGRFKAAQIKSHLSHLLAATADLSERLGYRPAAR